MVSEEQCERAVQYLARTDEEAAELKTDVERKAHLVDLAKRRIFLTSDGNNEERKAKAETSEDVLKATDEWLSMYVKAEKMRNRRATAELIIRTWQTASANRRQGNI